MIATERRPFQPKGDAPEWRMIYDNLLADADFGDTITLDQISDVLGRPFTKNRSPILRANKELGIARRRQLQAVPGVGYRVVQPNEHISMAIGRRDRAARQIKHGVEVLGVTDLARLTPAELSIHDTQTRINVALYSAVVHHEHRIGRLEEIARREGKL